MDNEDSFMEIMGRTQEITAYELDYAVLNRYFRATRYLLTRCRPMPWTLICAARSERDPNAPILLAVEEALGNRFNTYVELVGFYGTRGNHAVRLALRCLISRMNQETKDKALYHSVVECEPQLVKMLIENGANVNQFLPNDKTILSEAVDNCGAASIVLVRTLMEAGAHQGDSYLIAREGLRFDIATVLRDVKQANSFLG